MTQGNLLASMLLGWLCNDSLAKALLTAIFWLLAWKHRLCNAHQQALLLAFGLG